MNYRFNDEPFLSESAAIRYAEGAGFTVDVGNDTTASRPDMDTYFTLTQEGEEAWRWTRPFSSFSKR